MNKLAEAAFNIGMRALRAEMAQSETGPLPGRIVAQFETDVDARICCAALTAHHGKPFTVTPGIDMMYAVRPLIAERA